MSDQKLSITDHAVLVALARIHEQDVKGWLLGDEAYEALAHAELARREAAARVQWGEGVERTGNPIAYAELVAMLAQVEAALEERWDKAEGERRQSLLQACEAVATARRLFTAGPDVETFPELRSKQPPDAAHLPPAVVKYEPTVVPVNDERRHVRGARVRIETAHEVLETTVIPAEGSGPRDWIGAADRVEELNAQSLITLKLALMEAAQEGAAGKSGTIELSVLPAEPAASGSGSAVEPLQVEGAER